MSHVHTPTLVPGASLPGLPGHVVHPPTEPHAVAEAPHVDAERIAAAVTREALGALVKAGGSGRGQWAAIVALAAALAVHIVGDGTVRTKVDRMERIVEWLGARAIAEDRGDPPPPYPLL